MTSGWTTISRTQASKHLSRCNSHPSFLFETRDSFFFQQASFETPSQSNPPGLSPKTLRRATFLIPLVSHPIPSPQTLRRATFPRDIRSLPAESSFRKNLMTLADKRPSSSDFLASRKRSSPKGLSKRKKRDWILSLFPNPSPEPSREAWKDGKAWSFSFRKSFPSWNEVSEHAGASARLPGGLLEMGLHRFRKETDGETVKI